MAKKEPKTSAPAPATRAVIVAGARTPFVKAFGPFMKMDTIALGDAAVKGLLDKTGLDTKHIDTVVWGGVILPTTAPNLAREITLDLGLPATANCVTVTRACASGLQAITDAVAMIERGEAEVAIAGGSESTSNVGVELPNEVVHTFAPLVLGGKGGPMGESAEKMAGLNKIPRQAQDELALRSHKRAAEAYDKGIYAGEVLSVTTPDGKKVDRDGLLRPETSLEKLGKLGPAFKDGGTLTAGNSSALTDGAAAVLIMSEAKAKELGFTPLARIVSWAYVGVDPKDQLLIGPAIAMPLAMQRAGIELDEVDLVDIHEAFAAQVLSVLQAMESDTWNEKLGRDKPVGKVDPEKLNVHGGSLALGHPFGATGPRMVTTMANELHRSGKKYALLGICAAGGIGAAAVLERV
jgi:acetyl-CoA acyltransferase